MRWLALAAIGMVALLYARPLQSYFGARHDLAQRSAEVQALKQERRALERRLARSTTPQALTEEARRLGFVRPGERLFIVKGVSAWLHHKATIARSG
jgi:cell division protein FtsB